MKVILNLLVALVLLAPSPAAAYVYYTRDAVLEEFFGDGATEVVSWTPTAEQRARLKATLGYELPRPTWEIVVGRDGAGEVTGYAVLDSQLGQHEPIDFAVLLTPAGEVDRIEILVYREAYGEGVRSATFRGQFRGLTVASPMRPGKDIQIVSGATISTRAVSTGVRRACALLAEWRAS